jgi:hypothetical protein
MTGRLTRDAKAGAQPLGWMIATSILSWLVVAGTAGMRANPEALYGMLGPLAVASVSWAVTERTYRSRPERLTGVMVKGLAIKAVFFGAYVVVMLRVMTLRPVPFVLSFTGYFIGLYAMEALFMRRLFADAN